MISTPEQSAPATRTELESLGSAGAIVHGLGAITGILLVVFSPDTVSSVSLTLALTVVATVVALACWLAPWGRFPSWTGLVPILIGIGLITAGCANVGGNEGFYPFFYTYAAMMGGYYCTRRQTFVVIVAIAIASAPPIFYSDSRTPIEEVSRWVVIAALAAAVAVVLRKARERARHGAVAAEALARQDPLTGVSNRRAFQERAGTELARARRHGRELALLYVDLDGFKQVNDSAGHAAGDDVLRRVALGMAATLRGEDFIARIGGDEFAVLVPESGAEGARRVATRLIAAVERVAAPASATDGLGASIGWACFPDDAATVDELVEVADHALRQIKRERRVTGQRSATPIGFLGGISGLGGAAALPMLEAEADEPEELEPPPWAVSSVLTWLAGLAATAALLWFAGPLLVSATAVRITILAVSLALTAGWTTAAAVHTRRTERVGWALLAFGAAIAFIPVVGLVAGALGGIGIALIVMDRARLRDHYLMIDAACVLITGGLFVGAFLVPVLVDQLGETGELPAALAQCAALAIALTSVILLPARAPVQRRPDAWLLVTGLALGSATVVPFLIAAPPGRLVPDDWWHIAMPLAALLAAAGAKLRRSAPTALPAGQPRVDSGVSIGVVVSNVMLAILLIALPLTIGNIPGWIVGGMLVILALRHRRTQLTERDNARLVELARRSEADLGAQYRASLVALGTALEARDGYTGRHGEETVALAARVAARLDLPPERIVEVETVALLHDVGKIGTPNEILRKDAPLDDQEWVVMREHPVIGERILRTVPGLERVALAVRHEHEHWDGSGYPDGLIGEAIPLASRIVLVCDAYHAMTSDRPYRTAMPVAEAVEELRHASGSQFDPAVVRALLDDLAEQPPSDPAALTHQASS